MSGRFSRGFRRTLASWLLALLWCFSFSTSLYAEQPGNSGQSSTGPSDPWLQLKTLIDNFPEQLRIYNHSLLNQLDSANSKVSQLRTNNDSLLRSNVSLAKQNVDWQISDAKSQARAATLSQQLAQSQKALTDSSKFITQASRQVFWLRLGMCAAGSVAVVSLGYIGGHTIGWW